MKKYLFFLLLACGIAAISCTKEQLDSNVDITSVPLEGGTVNITINANVDWTVYTSANVVSFDKSSGSGSGKVVATIGENPAEQARAIEITISGGSLKKTVIVNQAANIAPEIKAKLMTEIIDFEAFNQVYAVTSTTPWTLTITSPDGYEVKSDMEGGKAGEFTVNVAFPENTTGEALEVTLAFETSNAVGLHRSKCTYEIPAPGFELGDVTYKAVKMKDGRWWMAENLRYVPSGYTPSSDLNNVTAGIYNPVKLNDAHTAVEFTTDEAVIKSNGYMYQSEVALGLAVGDLTTEEAATALEGAQGICPDGWHIPTATEIINLVGKAAGYDDKTDAPYYDSAIKDCKTIEKLNADGFNAAAWGMVSIQDNKKTSGTLNGYMKTSPDIISSGFLCGSTYVSCTKKESTITNFQFLGFMPMANNGSFNGAKLSYRIAAPVRCIKDAK